MDIDWIVGLIVGSLITFCLTLLFEFILPEKWRIKLRGFINRVRLRRKKFEVHMERSYSIQNTPKQLANDISQRLRKNKFDVVETQNEHIKAITSKEPLDRIDVVLDIIQNDEYVDDSQNRLHLKLNSNTRFKDLRDALFSLKSQEDSLSILFEEIPDANIRRISKNVDVRLKLENISELLHLLEIIHASRIIGEYKEYDIRMNTNSLTVSGPYDPEFEKIIRNILTYC